MTDRKLMEQPAECIGCGRDILPLCASETGTIHYSCSECGARFALVPSYRTVVYPHRDADRATYDDRPDQPVGITD